MRERFSTIERERLRERRKARSEGTLQHHGQQHTQALRISSYTSLRSRVCVYVYESESASFQTPISHMLTTPNPSLQKHVKCEETSYSAAISELNCAWDCQCVGFTRKPSQKVVWGIYLHGAKPIYVQWTDVRRLCIQAHSCGGKSNKPQAWSHLSVSLDLQFK